MVNNEKSEVRSQESGVKMKNKKNDFMFSAICLLASVFWLLTPLYCQQPEATTQPIFSVNAKYLQGRTWADYKATAGASLTLNIAAGTVWCSGTLATYAGGTLTMTNTATNYVFLDSTASCAPASNTSAFPATGIPVATVVAAGGVITTVTDRRALLIYVSAGAGNHAILSATHTDSLADSVVRGDVMIGNSTPKWARLAKGTSGYALIMGANDPAWTALPTQTSALLSTAHTDTTPAAVTRGAIITGQGSTPAWVLLAKGTANQCLTMDGTATDIAWGSCLGAGSGHNVLSATHSDSTASAAVRGGAVFVVGASPLWTQIAHSSTTGGYWKWNGTDVVASTLAAAGTGSCTNQFVTAENADAAPTCTTATLASSQFANQGTTTTLLHGNAAGNPSWAGVSLTADATVNQGTTTTLLHGNAAGAPSWAGVSLANDTAANQGTTTTVLHGNAAGNPAFGAVTSADTTGTFPATAHNVLSATHGDALTASPVLGDIIHGNATPAWARLAGNTAATRKFLGQTGTGAVSAVPAWTENPSGVTVNVGDYFPYCNGTTSDLVAIQAAVTKVGVEGGSIYFPITGCTGKFVIDGAITMPTNHKSIVFLLDNGWKITDPVDWLDTSTYLLGRAGGLHTAWQQKTGTDIECAVTTAQNCIEITTPDIYEVGFENLTFRGTAKHAMDFNRDGPLWFTNVSTVQFTEEALVLRHCFPVVIKSSNFWGPINAGTDLGAIGLWPSLGGFGGMPMLLTIEDTVFAYRGVHFDTTGGVDGANAGGYSFKNILYESYLDEFFVAKGNKTSEIGGAVFDQVSMADPIGAGKSLIKVTGSPWMKNISINNCSIDTINFVEATSTPINGLRIAGLGVSAFAVQPGPNYNYTWSVTQQNAMAGLFLGKFYNYVYDQPITRIEPESDSREGLVIRPYDGAYYADIFRVESIAGQNYFTLDELGKASSLEVGGSIKLSQLAAPGASSVIPQGTPGATTCSYKVVGLDRLGNQTTPSGVMTTNTANAVLDGTNFNRITFVVRAQTYQYQIWRTAAGGTPNTTGLIATIPASRGGSAAGWAATWGMYYDDKGAAGNGAAVPTVNATGMADFVTLHLTNVLDSAYGGTGNGFTKFTGPTTAEKTFTLPDASATIVTGTGTTNAIPKFTTGASGVVGDSNITDDGTTVAVGTTAAGKNAAIVATLGSEQAPALTTGNWTMGTGWQYLTTPDRLDKNIDGTGTVTPTAATTIVAGVTYKVVITVDSISGSTATYTVGGATGTTLAAATTYTDYLTASTTAKFILTPVATGLRMTISVISIMPLTDATGDLSVDGNLVVKSPASFSDNISIGARPALSGVLRIPNNQAIMARNSANTGDLIIGRFDAYDRLMLYDYLLHANGIQIPGNNARFLAVSRRTTSTYEGLGFTINAGGATAGQTDKAGGDLTLTSGISTGSGSSSILLKTATAGAPGTTDNTPTTKVTIAGDGTVTLATPLGSASGGTGNGFTKFTGPTAAEKTFTLPDASANLTTGTPRDGLTTDNANLDFNPLDTTMVFIREDWTSRNDEGSYSGSYTWTVGNIATGATGSAIDGVWPNLGLKRMTTAAAAGDGGLLHFTGQANALGALGSNAGWDSVWIFRINQTTATRLRVGFAAETATLTPVEGFYVRYDTNATYADTEWQLCARTSAGTETCYDTNIAVDTSFHKIRIRSILAGKVGFTLDAGTERTICAAGGSCDVSYTITAVALQPSLFIGTDTTAAKSADADFFAFKARGLTR